MRALERVAAVVTVAALCMPGCSLVGDDAETPLEPTAGPVAGGGVPTDPPAAGEATLAPTAAPSEGDRLAVLLDLGADQPLAFETVVTAEGAEGLDLEGAADPVTGRFALRFDYQAMIAVAAAADPAVAADPLLDDAAAVFGGEWRVRSGDGVVHVQNPGVVSLAGGTDGQWVRLPESLAATLIGPDGLQLLALPAEVGRRLAGGDTPPVAAADEVGGASTTRFDGTITVGEAPVAARLWISEAGEITRLELAFDGGASTIVTTYRPPDGPINRAVRVPDPADVVDLPADFGG